MNWLNGQKLNVKFTLAIGLVVFIPMIAIYFVLFHSLKRDAVRQVENTTAQILEQTYGEIQKTVDLCNMSTQVFLNNQNLNAFLIRLKRQEIIETVELVEFYKNDIAMLERLVNSNPYLYGIRVYAYDDNFSEMIPILFQQKRLKKYAWADQFVSGEWQFDYEDNIFGNYASRSGEHIMSLITSMWDYDEGEIGVLEVAVDMGSVFPFITEDRADYWGCFIDKYGRIYTGEEENRWQKKKETIMDLVYQKATEEERLIQTKLDGETVVIGFMPIKELSGYMVQLVSAENTLENINRQSYLYLAAVTVAFFALVYLINRIVKILLKRFYGIMNVIRRIQGGDLDVMADVKGNDEVGELGQQINKMLDRIHGLIAENVNRELLMKNSEIRALQNQINSHFIYNVLESIKMMAEIKEDYAISDAVTSLGRMLRYGMKWSSQNVTVRKEIEYIKDYLDLMNLRFDYEIVLSLKISDQVYEQEIPKMSLQPIVENAIYHGIEELAEDASIYIKALEYEGYCVLEITDSGKGMNPKQVRNLKKKIAGEMEVSGGSGNGIGLKNVQDRIRISFGEPYGIGVISKEGCYTKITVTIPLKSQEENDADFNDSGRRKVDPSGNRGDDKAIPSRSGRDH